MDATPKNPQSGQVPHEVEQRVLKLFEKHGWSVAILQGGSCTKLSASRGTESVRIAVLSRLYALSIMARYMPSAWRRIEGGDENQYLALVKAALSVWERLLPEQFLESIAGEGLQTAQPGSWY